MAEWRVRRKESGPGRHYSSWVRRPDRTFAVESEGKKLDELRWDGRRAAAAAPAAEVRPRFLRASPDGRFLFCLCAPEAGGPAVLRAFRTDAPSGTVRPACGSTPVEAITNLHYRFVVAPDGGAIVPVTGQVFGVTYPPAD